MSYWSLIKSLPEVLRQPSGIAAIASVGVHGLLWVVLPVLPLSSKTTESEAQRPVKLVELTPAEQGRLPSFATPQLSLPPLPKTTNLFPSLPSLQSSNSLPSSSSSPYNLPLFAPPPSGFSFSPSVPLPAPLGLPTTQIPIPDAPAPRISEPAQSSRPTIAFQDQPGLDAIQQNSQALQSQNLPQLPQLEASAPETINFPPTDLSPSEPVTPQPQPPSNSPEQTTPPATTQALPPETEQAAAPNTPPSAPGPRPDKIPAEAIARLREAQQRQQELYAYDATGTSNEEASGTLSDWTEETSQSTGKDFKRLELKPSYPTAACPRKLNGQATFGVVVDADGKIVGELARIQSAGYRLLNQKAEEAVRAYEFEGTGESQPYLVSLPFNYSSDTCADIPSEEAPPS
ncbi:energy transducer TonB [Trichocoleus sp. FACHB-591]|uniref:energy transducer TonB n=1 Tax=Trichocoleus sp. FACHB-591 TaxID=2692872 RepID=UPI00168596D5|nr:energy transducer TonB [Trichocoleus sp. FACHB-591]MBD2099079.1 energy transducer TonB [Trichocoleus sp. FACHB-591]